MSIKIENTVTPSGEQWQSLILGARNPMNSWEKSDSAYILYPEGVFDDVEYEGMVYEVGSNDLALMRKLAKAGTDHRKFMRMITVYCDILAPLYWWKEFDTYKVGTVANSCSTMHKIHENRFSIDDFSRDYIWMDVDGEIVETQLVGTEDDPIFLSDAEILIYTVGMLNELRELYLRTKDKRYWYKMIQLLPSSYNQKRTVMLNYEVLANIYKSRKGHRLDEWREFCKWIETDLPYSELITGEWKPLCPHIK